VLISRGSAETFLSHVLTDIMHSNVKSVLNRSDLKFKYDIMCHIEQGIFSALEMALSLKVIVF
ncbi:hypothetical protein, partial [Vibrio parahaemolyticus]|uniref:hypothetical protein n=1 Tax=Vibrio parahaemolyticus TaxID=670 RepID=UPI001C5E814B